MLTDTQVQVLTAVNDHCEIHSRLDIDPENEPLPATLTDLQMPTDEVLQALADLQELRLINGIEVAERPHPVVVMGLTARGRQELP